MIELMTTAPAQTFALGACFAKRIVGGVTICLEGDLGAGKTLFVQGIAAGMEVEDEVTSPTFSLMNVYEGKMKIYHFDLYRLTAAEELYDIGFYEYSRMEDDIVLIEWPDQFAEEMPEECIWISIQRGAAEDERLISAKLRGSRYKEAYEELRQVAYFSN